MRAFSSASSSLRSMPTMTETGRYAKGVKHYILTTERTQPFQRSLHPVGCVHFHRFVNRLKEPVRVAFEPSHVRWFIRIVLAVIERIQACSGHRYGTLTADRVIQRGGQNIEVTAGALIRATHIKLMRRIPVFDHAQR